jgi:hypothetical protein
LVDTTDVTAIEYPPRLWLTHHAAEQHDRCASVTGRLICRRCLFSYPIAITVMIAGLAGLHWPAISDPTLLWLLPAPAIAEFVLEHAIRLPYKPQRQIVFSALAGLAFGRGLTRYLQHNNDRLFWTVSITYSLIMAISAIGRLAFDSAQERKRAEQESDDWWAGVEANLDGSTTGSRPSSQANSHTYGNGN